MLVLLVFQLAPSKADGDEKDDESGEGIGRETREKRVVS